VKNGEIWNEVMGEGGGEMQTRNAVREVGVAVNIYGLPRR
jgi:hypothetical protein